MPTFKNDKLKRPRPRSPERARKSRGGPEQNTDSRDLCAAQDCGRPNYARGLCQTHHRQMLDAGKLKPIRPYRKRSADTVKLAGLRLTSHCAESVEAHAERHGFSLGAAIADILEKWHAESRREPGER